MTFLKRNIASIASMTFLFTMIMIGDSYASTVFATAAEKMRDLFKNAKMIIFLIGGFGLIALAFQAIFGKIKWPWFAALAFGLAVVAAAGAIVNYATNAPTNDFNDTLGSTASSAVN